MKQQETIPLINKFCTSLIQHQKADNTVRTYKIVLMNFHKWLSDHGRSLEQLTREDIQAYMSNLESEGKSAATIEKSFVAINNFVRYIDKPEITQNIRRKQKINNHYAPESLEKSERTRLLSDVKKDGNLRDIAIVYTLLHTGIRVSEICALNRSDIQISDKQGSLIVHDNNRNKKRIVPLSKDVQYHLKQYIDSLESEHEALFISRFNTRVSTRAIQYMLKKYKVNPHKLRHTFCSELIHKGVDIATVAELAGHADINITKRYSEPSTKKLEDAINRTFA